MSFKCHFCGESSAPGTSARLVVTKTREMPHGGTQIVQERLQCSTCYSATPEAVATRMADGLEYLTAERKASS